MINDIYQIRRELFNAVPPSAHGDVQAWWTKYVQELGVDTSVSMEISRHGKDPEGYIKRQIRHAYQMLGEFLDKNAAGTLEHMRDHSRYQDIIRLRIHILSDRVVGKIEPDIPDMKAINAKG